MGSQQTAPKESRYPIFVASEQRLDVSGEANIQPAATKVTNIGYGGLSLGASLCLRQIRSYSFSTWKSTAVNTTIAFVTV